MPKNISTKSDENSSALKHLLGEEMLKRVSHCLTKAYPSFDQKHFLSLMPALKPLEMKPRVYFIRDALQKLLPSNYEKALQVLLKSAGYGKLTGFDLWPYMEFVQTYGLQHFNISLKALEELTPLFTSEWAVRPFLRLYPKKTLSFLLQCTLSKDEHVRRWASEGTRPRLPWGERLHEFVRDPSQTLPILEKLKFDPSLYVRKSVANHLNDITKDHPELVLKTLTQWQKEAGSKHSSKIVWIIHRSLRTLIKNGNPGALKLIGVSTKTEIQFTGLKVHSKKIKLGERLYFEFEIKSLSKKPQKLVVDYIVHFVKANKTTSPKVFKLKTVSLPPQGELSFSKSHHFKKITTREYYPGTHALEIQINGIVTKRQEWLLEI